VEKGQLMNTFVPTPPFVNSLCLVPAKNMTRVDINIVPAEVSDVNHPPKIGGSGRAETKTSIFYCQGDCSIDAAHNGLGPFPLAFISAISSSDSFIATLLPFPPSLLSTTFQSFP